jgi:hypothetical protein
MGNLWFTEPYLNRLSHELKRSGPKHFENRLRFRRTKPCEPTGDQSDADHAKYEEPGKLAGRFASLGRVGHVVNQANLPIHSIGAKTGCFISLST